ncbi:MAG: lactonase family protein [Aristaeellaceae bacterium]
MRRIAYIGCRTTRELNARGRGIRVMEAAPEGWRELQLVENLVNPSFQCLDQSGRYLYTIHGDFSEISAFAVADDGRLTYLNTVSTGGVNPVHLSVDRSNRWIFVANLQTGTVAVIPRNADGTLAPLKELYTIPGREEGSVSHPHQVAQDPTGNWLIVSCQGRKAGFGQVDVFRIHGEDGTLEKTCTVRSREIAEPRHFVFHPEKSWCYGVNEKDYSVTAYRFDAAQGQLTPCQILPTLPDTYTGDGWASGIVMMPDGKHVVVSNRKHDSITSFRIREDGLLQYCDCVKTGGGQPRFITVSPWGTVIAANETTDLITEFALDSQTGRFTATGWSMPSESPVCLIFGA